MTGIALHYLLDRALERAEHILDQARGVVWLCRLWVRP